MTTWRDVNKDSWTFTRNSVIGAGGGVGEYRTSYALHQRAGLILNGRVSADVRLIDKYGAGAGLICRGDDLWNFLAFYVAPTSDASSNTVARLSAFRHGKFTPIACLAEPVTLVDDYANFSLEFYSGAVRGAIRTAERSYQITAAAPHVPFPGYVGVIKMYSAEVVMKNVNVEQTEMQFTLPATPKQKEFDFDVFLCHSGADKSVVREVAARFAKAGVTYWLDSEQIKYGDSITQRIEDGLQRSRYVIPCLSERLTQSGWTRAEYGAILNAEFSGSTSRTIIPLKLSESMSDEAIPLLLRDKRRVLYANVMEFEQFISFLQDR